MSTYVDIRATYVVQTYLLLVHNFYPYAEQQSPVVVTHPTSIGRGSDHYWSSVGPVVVATANL